MDYLLDTNIIIAYSRDDELTERLEANYQVLNGDHRLFVSIVTIGEIKSYIRKFKLGTRRRNIIYDTLLLTRTIDINHEEVLDMYADIDAFSQTKLKLPDHNFTARNMGKNDLWIAATAAHFGLTLLTTDRDFDHLDEAYLSLAYVDRSQ